MTDPSNSGARQPYVLLAPSDNVVVLTHHVDDGDELLGTEGERWLITCHLDAGNKLAARNIRAGEKVVKLGVAIGTATLPIASGDHVHTHNLRSDYIPLTPEEASGANAN